MKPSAAEIPVADVVVSEHLDHVVLRPRMSADSPDYARRLREALPQLPFRRVAGGICVPTMQSDSLLRLDTHLFDLRWTEETRQVADNRRFVKKSHPISFRMLRALEEAGPAEAQKLLNGLDGLDALDPHQWTGVAAMTLPESPGLCLFDEQGAGKTVTTIFAFDLLSHRDEIDFVLIVAPKSMIAEWPMDFRRFKHDRYRVEVATGSQREKVRALSSDADVVITNFETAVALEAELRAALRRYSGRTMLVVDESFYAKSLDAKRTRALRRLREWCRRAYVLCGTPAPNSPHDLVQQFNLADFGVAFEDVSIPEDRDAARPVVQRAIQERGLYIRHLKTHVLPDLPAKTFNRVIVPMAPVQTRLYRSALENLIVDLRAASDQEFSRRLTSFLARRAALLQICSNPVGTNPGYSEVPAKLLAMDSLLNELIDRRSEKVIVWSFYTASLDAIASRYSRYQPVRYDGSVADVAERRESVRRFQDDDETMLFVGNPAAAGSGLTLHRAHVAVYESMSNQCAHYLQSLDRIHRRGQSRKVEYLILLCGESLELQEYERLTQKERAAQDLLGDEAQRPITRETMLAETERAAQAIATIGR